MNTQSIKSTHKSQSGFSMFLVMGLLIMTTIVTTAVYRALTQSNLSSKNIMEGQSADAAAKAGKAASEAFMQYNAGEAAAIFQQFFKAQLAASPGDVLSPIEIPLDAMGSTKGQRYRVSLVDLNVTQPLEVKLQSEGYGSDGSKKVLTSVYYIKGIYVEDLSLTIGGVSLGDADGSELQDAIWAGGNASICGNVSLASAAGTPSSIYVGEDFDSNNQADGCVGTTNIDGNLVIGAGNGVSNIHYALNVGGDFYTAGEVNHGGGAASTLNISGNSQILADWNTLYGSATLNQTGSMLMQGDFSTGGSGAIAWNMSDDFKMDGDILGTFWGTISIQSTPFTTAGAGWDFTPTVNQDDAGGSFYMYSGFATNVNYDVTNTSGNTITNGAAATPNPANTIDPALLNIDAITDQLNASGEKDHPFHVKPDVEAKYSKTWAEWVALCAGCGLDPTVIGGSEINTLVTYLKANGQDDLLVSGAPLIDANDAGLSFIGGELTEKAIIRKDNNSDATTTTLLPGTSSTLGNPGGNLVFLSDGDYYNFDTDGDANVLVYATGNVFEYDDPNGTSTDVLYGNITAKDGTELLIKDNPTINYSQNVITASFMGGVFSKGAEEDAVYTSASSTSDILDLDKRMRTNAPTLNIQFMGSFENQVSVIDQQSADESTLQTPEPFLTFNKTTILSAKSVYTDFDEMRTALGIEPIYSYRGKASNCTTPSSSDYFVDDFDGENDSTFTIALTLNCSYQGDTVSTTSKIWVTMGAGSDGVTSVSSSVVSSAGSSAAGSSIAGSSDAISSEAGLSSSSSISSSSVANVCTKLPMVVHGLSKGVRSTVNPAQVGRFDRSNGSWDYEVMLKPDLSTINSTAVSAEVIIDWGTATTYWSVQNVYLYLQNALDSWNTSTYYDDFPTSDWTSSTLFASDEITVSKLGELAMHNSGSALLDWVNLKKGNADNAGFVLIANPAHYDKYKAVDAAYLNVCTAGAVPVSSSTPVSSSSVAISSSSVAVSSSSVAVSSSTAAITHDITIVETINATIGCSLNEASQTLDEGANLSLQVVCDADWTGNITTPKFYVDGVLTSTGMSYSVTADADKTVEVRVYKKTYTVTLETDPAGKGSFTYGGSTVNSFTALARQSKSFSITPLGSYTVAGWVGDLSNTSTSKTVGPITSDTTVIAIMKAPATDCDGSSDYSAVEASYAVGTFVKHNGKLFECLKYDQCAGVEPGTNGSIWFESATCAVVDKCTAYTSGICAWNGSKYACPSDFMSDDGTTAWKCDGSAYCQYAPSYASNAWGAWTANGTCN